MSNNDIIQEEALKAVIMSTARSVLHANTALHTTLVKPYLLDIEYIMRQQARDYASQQAQN